MPTPQPFRDDLCTFLAGSGRKLQVSILSIDGVERRLMVSCWGVMSNEDVSEVEPFIVSDLRLVLFVRHPRVTMQLRPESAPKGETHYCSVSYSLTPPPAPSKRTSRQGRRTNV